MTPRHPNIKVKLVGENGNAIAILSRCNVAARHHLSSRDLEKFMKEAKSSDYDHLLQTCMEWFDCE